jgi:hypothetical protein
MGFLDKAKDKYNDERQKLADRSEQRGSKLTSLDVTYVGGYQTTRASHGTLKCYEHQIEYGVSLANKSNNAFALMSKGFTIPNNQITDITFDGKDQVIQQRTIARNLLFAGKSKKQEIKDAYVTLVLANGGQVMFQVNGQSPNEVRSRLAILLPRLKQGAQTAILAPSGGIADELAKLAALKAQGVLTEAEFALKKAELLA